MDTHHDLGQAMADALGYRGEHSSLRNINAWYPPCGERLLKHEHQPRITSFRAMTRLYGKDWFVDLYAWEEPEGLNANVVGISGNLDAADETMQKLRGVIPPALWDMYERKLQWLRDNPMYQETAVKATETKARVSPSQLIV